MFLLVVLKLLSSHAAAIAAVVAAIVVGEAGAGVGGSGVALHAVVRVVLLLVLKNSRRGRHLQAIIAKPYTTRKPPWKQP